MLIEKAKPTKEQLIWSECEIGAMFHYDITVFEQNYHFRKKWGYHPAPKVFAPDKLDTDQWIAAAKAAGAKYAVLVAKHCTGFALFPSKANEYNVKNATYTGDIVANFVASCKKYDVLPGVYYSAVCNAFENVDNPGKPRSGGAEAQKKYNKVIETQLSELWGNYGKMFELWFDGGTLAVSEGGLDISALLKKYQPDSVTFQGDRLHDENNLRWVGNERGFAPFNCYSTINGESQYDGEIENANLAKGDKGGKFWKPVECDAPIRKNNAWFYIDGKDNTLLSLKTLRNMYFGSVGRNCNLLLGIVVDRHGLVPVGDVRRLEEFGAEIKDMFGKPLKSTSGKANGLSIVFDTPTKVDTIVLKEDITDGHSICGYEITAETDKDYEKLFEAEVIGHKRIARFTPTICKSIRININGGDENAALTEFSVYNLNRYTLKDKIRFALVKEYK